MLNVVAVFPPGTQAVAQNLSSLLLSSAATLLQPVSILGGPLSMSGVQPTDEHALQNAPMKCCLADQVTRCDPQPLKYEEASCNCNTSPQLAQEDLNTIVEGLGSM